MAHILRDGTGLVLVLGALGALGWGLSELASHDYLSAILAIVVGLSVMRAGVDLLRPTVGE
ncbi:MAG: hypothetical protein AB7S26_15515 [Sandaracinaceae bacterium]